MGQKEKFEPSTLLEKLQKESHHVVPKQKVTELKESDQLTLMQEVCQSILSEPERKLNNINTLFHLAQVDDLYISQCALFSMCELFVNICPLYKLDRSAIETKMRTTLNKEERQLINFEHMLLNNYEKYLKMLNIALETNTKELMPTVLKCYAGLLDKLMHFNNSAQIAQVVVKFSLKKDPQVHSVCQAALETLLCQKDSVLNPVKQQLLTAYGTALEKKRENQLPNDLIKVINNLELDRRCDAQYQQLEEQKHKLKLLKKEKYVVNKDDKEGKRKENSKEDRNQFKKKKVKNTVEEQKEKEKKMLMKELKEDLKDESGMQAKTVFKGNIALLEKAFYLYFKVLCKPVMSKYYKDALNGILKHVHHINVELIWNILDKLKESFTKLRGQPEQEENRLLCLLCMNNIIDGPGKHFEVDDLLILINIYGYLKDVYTSNRQLTVEQHKILLPLLQKSMITHRQYGNTIVSSFIVLFSYLIKQQTHQVMNQTLVFLMHKVFQKYPKQLTLLDTEGDTTFNMSIDDPQITDAPIFSIRQNLKDAQYKHRKSTKYHQSIQAMVNQNKLGPSVFTLDLMSFYRQQ